jgi:hypothetical protein
MAAMTSSIPPFQYAYSFFFSTPFAVSVSSMTCSPAEKKEVRTVPLGVRVAGAVEISVVYSDTVLSVRRPRTS